jgi:hypothetical protein
MKVPDLNQRIDAHAQAVIASDDRAAEAFVTSTGLPAWKAASASAASQRPFKDFELLACAKIGMQFMAKTRFSGEHGSATLLIRWKKIDGTWMIAEAEDITGKRSPWSDIPHYSREGGGASNA